MKEKELEDILHDILRSGMTVQLYERTMEELPKHAGGPIKGLLIRLTEFWMS